MGKTIEVNLSYSDLLSRKNKLMKAGNHLFPSEGTTDLRASFSKKNLEALLNINGCDGFRLYSAAFNNELIMIAVGTKGEDDLFAPHHFCLASNQQGAISVQGIMPKEGVDKIPFETAKILYRGGGSDKNIMDKLNEVRTIEGYKEKLKVLFDKTAFFQDHNDYDDVLFELVDLTFTANTTSDSSDTARTIIGTINKDGRPISTSMSMLPCPPNCGGIYANEIF